MGAVHKVAILGSGPAGLSAAARAAMRGMDHVLLEKTNRLSDTIFRYQRGKHIMATPTQLVLRSDIAFEAGRREVILDRWNDQIGKGGVNVRYNAEATAITGQRGDFQITLADGETLRAETIVLAIGTQGNPNRLSIPGADMPNVQYSLDDPTEYVDEHIVVVGGGDAGIENALGLIADAAQGNVVTLLNKSMDFARAKEANVKALMEARDAGRITILPGSSPGTLTPGFMTIETPEGPTTIRCDRVIARMGSAPPRKFIESVGVAFTSADREAFPALTETFESTVPGIYVIGALAGYPLIKHCMNQGYDVIEFIAGNAALKPADEPILEARLKGLPGSRSVADWLEFLRTRIEILNGLSPLQMREFLLDSEVRAYRPDEIIFQRNSIGSSMFGIAEGSVKVEINPKRRTDTVAIGEGSIFGEVGLISGRRRGATVRAAEPVIVLEMSRNAALRLMAQNKEARETINRITTERQLLQIFGSGLTREDVADVLSDAELMQVPADAPIITEGEDGYDIFIVRSGSMVVEKSIGGKQVFLSYLPAGSYVGEMALIDGGRRSATVKAAIRSEVVRLDGDRFRALLRRNPELEARMRNDMASRRQVTNYIEDQKHRFSGVVDMYSSVADFLVDQGIGEATDVLLIDETLCVGCDNCEKACADIHDGLSRLDREAGRTYAHLHVPTSCRHCEHPYCMTDCPPNAIHRGPDGEVFIDESCIGCGNCQRYCPYGVIRMDSPPPKRPGLLPWMLFGAGPGPGEPDAAWKARAKKTHGEVPKVAIKCDMCAGKDGGPACVRACPTGAAIRVSPENFLTVTRLQERD
jgi:Fe-S-cluster-containing hydrogenase component 2/thioredoxin reductase/CRP-like cAMP-binding protein